MDKLPLRQVARLERLWGVDGDGVVVGVVVHLTPMFALSGKAVLLPPERLFCVCRHPDDGRQAVECILCKEWFHADCMYVRVVVCVVW